MKRLLLLCLIVLVSCTPISSIKNYKGCFSSFWSDLNNAEIGAYSWNMTQLGGECPCESDEVAPCTWFLVERYPISNRRE